MFAEDADKVIVTIKELKRKLKRVNYFVTNLNPTTKNILISTYVFSKIRYGMVVMWDLIPKTRRITIETKLRAATKRIK